MVSPLLPWYDNRNSFGIGDSFLGIQGPLFLVGYLVMAFGAISFFNLFFPLMGKNFFQLKRKSGATAMILGAQSLFLLVVSSSVFYHPSFGTNVSHKGTRFGMILAFASIAVMLLAGYMTHRREKNGEMEDEEVMVNPVAEEQPYTQEQPNYGQERPAYSQERPSYQSPQPAVQSSSEREDLYGNYQGDPLELDAKTRYKMLKAQQRRASQGSQTNLWGGQKDLSENMRIRTDL